MTLEGLNDDFRDVIAAMADEGVEFAWASRVEATVEGRTVHFIGRDAFMKNKLAAGRPKDLADAARLAGPKPD
jgi:hypothetical protein